MCTAIVLTAALLVLDRVLKLLAAGASALSGKILRLTHLENPGFFLGAGSRYRFIRGGCRCWYGSRRPSCCCPMWSGG